MHTYLKESFHWLHLAFFKPSTLREEAERLTRKEALKTYFKTLLTGLVIVLALEAVIGVLCEFAGYSYNWSHSLRETIVIVLIIGLFFGLFFGLRVGLDIGLDKGLGFGLSFGLFVGLFLGLSDGLAGELFVGLGFELFVGLFFGLVVGLGFGLFIGLVVGLDKGLFVGLGFGLFIGLVVGLFLGLDKRLFVGLLVKRQFEGQFVGLEGGWTVGLTFLLIYLITFFSIFFRPFYLFPYAVQYWRFRKSSDPFKIFHNSPVYWDEAIAMPLPYLADWLVRLANRDRERGLDEIRFVATKLPYQRRAAQKALIAVAIQDLQQISNVKELAKAANILKIFPAEAKYLPKGLDEVQAHINVISTLAQDFSTRLTLVGQIKVLEELQEEVQSWVFTNAIALTSSPMGRNFQALASRWLNIVKTEEAECQKQLAIAPIPNPFIVGNPLQLRDEDLFKGRNAIIIAIEENIINANQRPALLLYGRRRIGKSSTLLHLPRLLSSQYLPIFMDCQNAKWRDNDAAFCYHLAKAIFDEVQQRDLSKGLSKPQLEEFEKNSFTKLEEFLDQIEGISRRVGKQILLTFDEYEKLEEGITSAKITTEIFNQFRNIIQHRERIVVLFSGSHRFEEARIVNWSDYLINVKTLELSFLSAEDSRELITRPVPDFKMQYDQNVPERILELTHCQPYLLQAVASELVNYLNSQKRFVATSDDLDIAIEKVLITAQAYFHYTWAEDCTEEEKAVLLDLATNGAKSFYPAEHQKALQSLSQKEIIERQNADYHFTIGLFRLWIMKTQVGIAPHELLLHSA